MKTEKEIRERIRKLDIKLKKKIKIKNQKDLDKAGIKGMILLAERYSLWWVLEEVKKFQGRKI